MLMGSSGSPDPRDHSAPAAVPHWGLEHEPLPDPDVSCPSEADNTPTEGRLGSRHSRGSGINPQTCEKGAAKTQRQGWKTTPAAPLPTLRGKGCLGSRGRVWRGADRQLHHAAWAWSMAANSPECLPTQLCSHGEGAEIKAEGQGLEQQEDLGKGRGG